MITGVVLFSSFLTLEKPCSGQTNSGLIVEIVVDAVAGVPLP